MLKALSFTLLSTLLCLLPSCAEHDYNPTHTSFDRLSQKIAKQYRQRFLSSGTGSLSGGDKVIWAFSVMETRNVPLEEAKILAANMLKTMLDAVLPDPLYADYFQRPYEKFHKRQLGPEYFGFRVAFWDENMDRPLAPYIAQIRAADGWVYFYYADSETQALQMPPVLTISYQELLDRK